MIIKRKKLLIGVLIIGLGVVLYAFYAGYEFNEVKKDRTRIAYLFIDEGEALKKSVAGYFIKNNSFPSDLKLLNVPDRYAIGSNPPHDSEDPGLVAYSASVKNGVITFTFDPDQGAVSGKTMVFEPMLDSSRAISWSCKGGTVAVTYRPIICRG